MPFVVPDICRYTVHGTNEIGACDNVLDIQIDTTGVPTGRDNAIQDFAGDIITFWSNRILPRLSTTYAFESVSWVDLDEADGSVGSRSSTDTITLPDPGGFGGEAAPANVSVLVRKECVPRRGQRKGRTYFSPIGEAGKNGSYLTVSELGAWTTAAHNLFTDLDGTHTVGASSYDAHPVVVHILTRDEKGNPLTGDYTPCTDFVAQELLATQRRRMRR